jgi:hypothetical protein
VAPDSGAPDSAAGGDTETLAFVPDVYHATIRDIRGFAAPL